MLLHVAAVAALAFSLPNSPPSDALLRVRLANCDITATEEWLRRRPFAAVLPIQPMLVQPLAPPQCGLELTFRRKPNSEKGGQDGGLRFALSATDEGDEGGDGETGVLLVTRIVEGQYTTKIFSEKKLLRRLISDLEMLPSECGSVLSVVDLTLGEGPDVS